MKRIEMLKAPFNYQWPRGGKVSVIRQLGEIEADDVIAEAAIAGGYARPVTAAAKPKGRTAKPKAAILRDDAATTGESDSLDRADLAAPDRPGGEHPPMDQPG